mmetsp:Transcript_97081/g.172805  ORF Transcript_97081/g.172805 Transcript_97081/m.172805 type:complete len:270 (-) Transcript_97081:196-1005(-)
MDSATKSAGGRGCSNSSCSGSRTDARRQSINSARNSAGRGCSGSGTDACSQSIHSARKSAAGRGVSGSGTNACRQSIDSATKPAAGRGCSSSSGTDARSRRRKDACSQSIDSATAPSVPFLESLGIAGVFSKREAMWLLPVLALMAIAAAEPPRKESADQSLRGAVHQGSQNASVLSCSAMWGDCSRSLCCQGSEVCYQKDSSYAQCLPSGSCVPSLWGDSPAWTCAVLNPWIPCEDLKDHCPQWASQGDCETNAWFMLEFCRKSCHQC